MSWTRGTPGDLGQTVHESAPQNSDAPSTGTGSSDIKPVGFGRLARRITACSGNFLAACVILILGFTFGRQVLQWWRNDPGSASVTRDGSLNAWQPPADPTLPHLLEFGDLPIQLTRQVFVGDQEAALEQLRRTCRKAAVRSHVSKRTALPASDRLLHRLNKLKPVEQGKGWKIYQTGGPVLMVLAVRTVAADKGGQAGSAHAESVVSWGLGLRQIASIEGKAAARANRWTLLTGAADCPNADSRSDLVGLIPPGSHRTLAVRFAGGGALIGFRGPTSLENWKRFFDQQGWLRRVPWLQMEGGWVARYQRSGSETCDVVLTAETDGLGSGILTITPETKGYPKD